MSKYSIKLNKENMRSQMEEVWQHVQWGVSNYGEILLSLSRADIRSIVQNKRLWAMCTDVSKQIEWSGQYPTPEEWKHIFSAALDGQKCYPGIDGGLVFCGKSTSNMSKKRFSDMLEIMFSWGAENGVVWSDPQIVSMYNEYVIKESGNSVGN